ncbi:hypothetical protein [Solimonas aquatica]|nr:hypothetical protein [Solimonas aquatica]
MRNIGMVLIWLFLCTFPLLGGAADLVIPQSLRGLPIGNPPYSYVDGPNLSGLSKRMKEADVGQEWFDFVLLLQRDTRYGVLSAGNDYWRSGRLDPEKIQWLPEPWGNEVQCPAPHCFLFGDALTWLITADSNYKVIDYQLIFGRETRYDEKSKRQRRVAFLDSQISDGTPMRYAPRDQNGNYLDFRTTGVFCSSFSGPYSDSEIRLAKGFPMEDYNTWRPGNFVRKVEKDGRIISKLFRLDPRGSAKCIYDG